jgi:hypothetical protein
MTLPRRSLLAAIAIISLLLAYFLRDVVYQVLIVPLAYMLWVLGLYYSLIPQWVQWALLVAALLLVVLWNLLPDIRFSPRRETRRHRPPGEVESLANWIVRARHGNYFKWQIANRFGRIARRLNDVSGPGGRQHSPDEAVESYLDAGTNYSFVDFLRPRNRFERLSRTPLDIDLRRVADYLESQMENTSVRR